VHTYGRSYTEYIRVLALNDYLAAAGEGRRGSVGEAPSHVGPVLVLNDPHASSCRGVFRTGTDLTNTTSALATRATNRGATIAACTDNSDD
jgi:hypothetical protein